ncbi:DUF2807 domain-containing protein [Erythrobacter arachoides]|uniref:DUF2807 domain-containing protein n=1 Tax=Aurantiacibacter arachoides TaxID=1850444 RepID=A0A845AAT3_9SPHN|nr:head GIN domain-containing protein [Aurantiacibacter arachoides]MXO94659.1 DUF2807 domain-containing protein [Aurantiacibacter arachoides]GGD61761.1 DUF2807 domain-containing protein [Aurantiacibacter arachoides]
MTISLQDTVSLVLGTIAAIGLGGCEIDDRAISHTAFDGVPLAQLETAGAMPAGVVLGGADRVVIVEGARFAVTVDGSQPAKDRMRFAIEDDALVVGRADGEWDDDDVATVTITMPAPSTLVIGGSGTLTSFGLADDADVVIGGSGTLDVQSASASDLSVVIGGSGSATLAGTAGALNLVIAGSGSADMARLQVTSADVNVAGSGDATFSTDGAVDATIVGSGQVTVNGNARCEVQSLGSGALLCGGREIAAR